MIRIFCVPRTENRTSITRIIFNNTKYKLLGFDTQLLEHFCPFDNSSLNKSEYSMTRIFSITSKPQVKTERNFTEQLFVVKTHLHKTHRRKIIK